MVPRMEIIEDLAHLRDIIVVYIESGTKSWRKPEVTKMAEFTSEPQKTFNPVKLYITGAVILLLGALVLVMVHYRGTPAKSGTNPVVVQGLLRPGNTNFDYYKTRVRIEGVKASLGISFNSARIAMINGIIVNDGDRKLEAVELHITLYDKYGKLSKERTAFALRPGAGMVGRPMEPLEKRTFTIGIEAVEVMWDPTQVTYEITGLKYE
jgi:hypothetical protein